MGGDWDLVTRVAVWGVGFGVVGARLYHDLTSWNEVPSPKWKGIFEVWQGGLGVWGGILFGTIAGAVVVHRSGYSVTRFMDAAAPGLLLAQGIGRIGNWWNQELYRQADDAPLGPEDRPREPAAPVLQQGDLPPDVPVRADLGLRGRRAPDLGREAMADPAARPVRALRRLLLLRALLRGAPAGRSGAPHRRAAPERLGVDRLLRRLDGASSSGGSGAIRSDPPASRNAGPSRGRGRRWRSRRGASASAVTVRAWRFPSTSSSWTWTPSRGRSTCCCRSCCARSCRSARSTSPTW